MIEALPELDAMPHEVEETSFFENRATGHSKVAAPGARVEIGVEIDGA